MHVIVDRRMAAVCKSTDHRCERRKINRTLGDFTCLIIAKPCI